MVLRVMERFGQIDVLVNNAGIISVGPIESQTIEDFQQAMDVMFWGQVYTTLAVFARDEEAAGGMDSERLFDRRQDQHPSPRAV